MSNPLSELYVILQLQYLSNFWYQKTQIVVYILLIMDYIQKSPVKILYV